MQELSKLLVEKTKELYTDLFRELSEEIFSYDFGLDFEKEMLQLHLKQIKFEFRCGMKCIDVGSGSGRYSAIFKMLYPDIKVFSLDLSAKNLLQYSGDITLINADASNIPFKDNTFDFLMCFGVIQHTAVPHKVIAEILRVTKPQGVVLLYTYGKGIYNNFIKSLRTLLRLIGHRKLISKAMFQFAKLLHLNSRAPVIILDELYVPIRFTFSHKELENMINSTSKQLKKVNFLTHPKNICPIRKLRVNNITKIIYALAPRINLIEIAIYL